MWVVTPSNSKLFESHELHKNDIIKLGRVRLEVINVLFLYIFDFLY